MSEWLTSRGAFVWTLVGDEAYRLLWFNQSRGGVYLFHPDKYHLSIHTDGNSHSKWPKDGPESVPDLPFKLRPIKELELHMIGGEHCSLYPDQVRHLGEPIPRPAENSLSLFADPSLFGPLTQLVIESFRKRPRITGTW